MPVPARRRWRIYQPRLELLEGRLAPAVVTVTTTADDVTPNDGTVSLREAILAIDAGNDLGDSDITNQNPGTFGSNDAIHFNVGSAGVQTINVGASGLGALPAIFPNPVTINGSTEPGFAGTPLIVLDGANAGAGSDGLLITAGSCTINDLSIIHFQADASNTGGTAIEIQTNGGNRIFGNYLGVDSTGSTAAGNQGAGILLFNSTNDIIGISPNGPSGNVISGNKTGIDLIGGNASIQFNRIGVDASGTIPLGNLGNGISLNGATSGCFIACNVISANSGDGIAIEGIPVGPAQQDLIQSNFIGTDLTGTATLGNQGHGISMVNSIGNTVGGSTTGSPNVISGNLGDGILIQGGGSIDNIVAGNFIGTDHSGTQPLGNSMQGVEIINESFHNTVGGTATGAGNVIAFNQRNGVVVGANATDISSDDSIFTNSIFSNGGLGIDLGDDGPTPNQSMPFVNAPNNGIDFPVLESAGVSGGAITIQGSYQNFTSAYTLQFFSSPSPDPSGFGEGKTFLGSISLIPNQTRFIAIFPAPPVGSAITATATLNGNSNTSEFSHFVQALPAPTVTLSPPTPNPSVFGEPVTFTATVSSSSAGPIPTGTVSFTEGSSFIGFGTLDSNGQATFTPSMLPVGMHTINAVYSGDTNFPGSSSTTPVTETVQGPTTTILRSMPNPSVFGQSVMFTASVTSPGTIFSAGVSAIPTGTVTFMEGTTILGTAMLDGSVLTFFGTSALAPGTHNVTAIYSGDSTFVGSTSNVVSQIVQATTTTMLTSAPNPSVFGQPVTFTATVSSSATGVTPTGTVTFMEGTTTLGTGTLDATGQATFSTSALSVGMHTVTAAYSGDSQFATSSGTATQTVNMASTTTALTSAPNPSVFGESVLFTATVTVPSPGAGIPTGTVAFMEGATTLGTGMADSSGQATFSTTALAVGPHNIVAVYSGDTNFTGSTSSPDVQTVNQASTTTSLTSAPNPSDLGQSVLFTATVTPVAPGAGSPTGTVTFMEGSTVLGTSSLNSGSVATFNTFTLLAGTHTVIAVYAGDSSFTGSTSPAVSQTVNKGPTTTTLTSAPNPSVFGQAVVFTATVTTSVEGVGANPTGTVSFIEGTTTLGTGTLDATGHATFTTSALTVGTHQVSAVYNGDSNFVTSTATAITQTVNKASTTTSLTSGANPSVFGQPVVFTATVAAVAPGAGTPTGTVTFMENSVVLGTATLGANGQATFMTSMLTVGTHTIIASYGGDTHFLTSNSTSVSQVVNKASTTTTLLALPDPATAGQPIMFQSFVRVVAPGAGTPTGTVSFMEGATVLATASLTASMATATIPSLTAGTHTLVAQYSGDASFAGSNSPATVLVVNAAGSLQGSGVPVRAAEGRPLQNVVVANFTDTTGIQPASSYQATINWGDGTAATAGTVTSTGTTPNETGGAFQVTGSHTYAAEGTFTVTITIARTGVAALTLTTTATVGGFVTQLYHDVLGRLPDAGGLSFWVSQLHQGLLTRTQVATSFWVSVEHRGLEVDQMYTTILHRPADAAGRAGWVNALLAGMPEGAVVIQFLTSVEYTASHPDNTSYVVGLYQDVLKRTATAQEIAGWVASLADGSLSRAQVAAMFLSSNEAFTQAIDDYYATFLGRAPDAVGFQSFLTQAQAGQLTPTTITAEFLGSDEYFNRALALAVL